MDFGFHLFLIILPIDALFSDASSNCQFVWTFHRISDKQKVFLGYEQQNVV